MSINITLNKIILVKESAHRYNLQTRTIHGPADAAHVINTVLNLQNEAQEVLVALLLNTKNDIVGIQEISRGSLSASIVHPREVFKAAILHNAAAIILSHNHPSGNPSPSREDLAVTERIANAGKILDIPLLDHVVIGDPNFISMREKDMIKG